jgi:hypothetical protein
VPLGPPVQIREAEIIKITKFQDTFNLNDQEALKLQFIIYENKLRLEKFNTTKISWMENAENEEKTHQEGIRQHWDTMDSHTIEEWNFNGRQEVHFFNQSPVQEVVQNDYPTLENHELNPEFVHNQNYSMENRSLMGRYGNQSIEEVQTQEIQDNDMTQYLMRRQGQQATEASLEEYTPESSMETDRRLQLEEIEKNTRTIIAEEEEPMKIWNLRNPHKNREVHRAEKEMMYDSVTNIEYLIVNQQQIDTIRYLDQQVQMKRVIIEAGIIQEEMKRIKGKDEYEEMKGIMEILEKQKKFNEEAK